MLLVDTGVFLAAADDSDPDHDACVALLVGTYDELLTTALVVAEAAYLIERQLGPVAEAGFFRSLGRGDVTVESLTAADLVRTAELVERYADFPLGGTDASLVAVAERLGPPADRHARSTTLHRRAAGPHRLLPATPLTTVQQRRSSSGDGFESRCKASASHRADRARPGRSVRR